MVGKVKKLKWTYAIMITLIALTRQLPQISTGEMLHSTMICAESQVHEACLDILRWIFNLVPCGKGKIMLVKLCARGRENVWKSRKEKPYLSSQQPPCHSCAPLLAPPTSPRTSFAATGLGRQRGAGRWQRQMCADRTELSSNGGRRAVRRKNSMCILECIFFSHIMTLK
jgi:hypothetical protein